MDEIIYLELDEEIPSVIDKIKGLSGKSVALVIPKGASIIQSVINLKILKKEAETLKKDIVLVTQDRIGRNLASQVGLSVYDNIRSSKPVINPMRPEPEPTEVIELDLSEKPLKAPKGVNVYDYQEPQTHSKEPQYKPSGPSPLSREGISTYKPPILPKSKKSATVKIIIVLILIIAGIVLCYFYLPKAKINLVVQSDSFETTVEISADNNINKIDEVRNAIPGELVEVELEEAKTFQATGTKDLGEKASGTIKLSNGTGVEQSIGSGTTFTANGLAFISTDSITVPKATASVDAGGNVVKSPGTANVKVQAKEAGDKYNIGASKFSTSASVDAESTNAMSGGVSKKIKIVTDQDINNAKNELKNTLVEKNREEIKKKAGKKQLNDSTISNEEMAFSSSKTINSEADSFEARLKVKSRAIVFGESDYRAIIASAINKNVPPDKEVILADSDEISTVSGNADFSTGILKLQQKVKTHVGGKFDEAKIINQSVGKKKDNVETDLVKTPGVKSVSVEIKPSWWPKTLPRIKNNIQIKKSVEQEQK